MISESFKFNVILQGWGKSPEEAWDNAVKAFSMDPGPCPDDWNRPEEEE